MKSLVFLSLLTLCGSALAVDKASGTSSAPSATSVAPKSKSTCPAKYDPKCGFICGQKSIEHWYCSEKNVFPEPTDDNWCNICPGGPNVPGKYGPSTIPASVLSRLSTSTSVEGGSSTKAPGAKATSKPQDPEREKATSVANQNGGQVVPAATATTARSASKSSSQPAPVFSNGASGVNLGSAAAIGFLGFLLAF